MAIDKTIKSNRLLQSRRYTVASLTDAQEAFTSVLDINSKEVYAQANLLPTSSLPFSGSSQNGSIYSVEGQNLLKYWYQQTLTPSNVVSASLVDAWFFLDPSGSSVTPQIIQSSQQNNFISNKYASPSLTNADAQDNPPGYNVVVLVDNVKQNPANYQFDYKNGVLQFNIAAPTPLQTVKVTAYQYVGQTVDTTLTSISSSIANLSSSLASLSQNKIVEGTVTGSVSSGSNSFTLVSGSNELFTVRNSGQTIISGSLDVTGSINGLLISRGNGNVSTNISIGSTTAFSSSNTGNHNTAIGYTALRYNTTGYNNTAIGRSALYYNTTGYNNTAIGYRSLYQNTTGNYNTAIGRQALLANTTGYHNTAIGNNALLYNTVGNHNTAIGNNALLYNTVGNHNTAIGNSALGNNQTGAYNTAIGYGALISNTTGSNNIAIGRDALLYNTTGSNNIAFGYDSGRFIANGSTPNTVTSASIFIGRNTRALGDSQTNQIVIGDSAIGLGSDTAVLGNDSITTTALKGNVGIGTTTPNAKLDVNGNTIISGSLDVTGSINGLSISRGNGNVATNISIGATTNFSSSATGTNNFAAGNLALSNLTTGVNNTAIGNQSLRYNTTGESNTAIGNSALRDNSNGGYNTAIGLNSLQNNTTGNFNTAIGNQSLRYNTTGVSNTAIGYGALRDNTTGYNNTAIGLNALFSNTTGNYNTAIGRAALLLNTTGRDNTAIGYNALYQNTTGAYNTAIGRYALRYNTTGRYNTAIGLNALFANTTGFSNTAIGNQALQNNTYGNHNTAIGLNSLRYNSTGAYNTAIGITALSQNTIGNFNTAIGYYALQNNTTGQNNTAIGRESLRYNETGYHNTAIGNSALYANTTGSNNIAFGYDSGRFIADGIANNTAASASIFIGRNTRALADNQTNQIVIGDSAIGLGSNTVVLGNDSITTTALRGNVGIGTNTPNARLDISGSAIITGSLTVTNGITGSLFGTASFATNAANATSASFAVNATSASFATVVEGISSNITNNTDNRILTATGGGSINGESNLTFNGSLLTVTGDAVITNNLTVQGTASFQNTTNLEVADRFVLFASGSNTPGDGGIVVQQGTQNVGELFGFDNGTTRWAFTSSFNAANSDFTPDAFVTATVIGTGTVPTAAPARYQATGNIFIGTDEDIWIYS